MRAMVLAPLLVGCGAKEEIVWLEGSRYGWRDFNHRLAHWETRLEPDSVSVAVVGGTSTTNRETVLPEGCDPKTCTEYPQSDEANVLVRWARAETSHWHAVRTNTTIVAGTDGAATTVSVALPKKGRSVFALIEGFAVDGGEPLTGGDACYTPENGWMPTELGITLANVSLSNDGMKASVDVRVIGRAGKTLEDVRECVDEVVDQAQFRFEVDVLFVEGTAEESPVYIVENAEYAYEYGTVPDPQPEPKPYDLQQDLDRFLTGWSRVYWQFDRKDPDTRGAYLRTLGFEIVADDSSATGIASNYSPITQLSGFDYLFEGTVQLVELGTDVTRGTIEETIPADLDADGNAIVTTFPL
jgi:hypothetical protein